MKLSKSVIDQAFYHGTEHRSRDGKTVWSRCVLWDDEVGGLGLRVTPAGKKSFVLSYRIGSRKRQMKLGAYGVLTVQQARGKAYRALADVAEGRDPLARKQAARQGETVAHLAKRYLLEHAEVKKKPTSVETDRQMLRAHVLPKLGRFKIADVTRRDVIALHYGLRRKPYAANRVLALLSKMFNLAERWGLRSDGTNPSRHVERFKETRRERYLSPAELAQLAEALAAAERDGSESPHAVAAIRLLILTGCRLREILRLRWQDVDLGNSRLHLPDSKTGAKMVYLSAPAREILATLPRTASNPWVVEGRNPRSHLKDLKGPWKRLCERTDLKNLRLHDLRHSFAAVGAGLGLSLPMIGKLLGHSQPATTARYAHLAADPMHEAADRIGAELAAAMNGSEKAPVVEIGRREQAKSLRRA